MIEELVVCDDSRIPVVWFVTHEEGRAESEITMHAKATGGKAWVWSLTSNGGGPGWEPPRGAVRDESSPLYEKPPFDEDESSSPEGAVKAVIDYANDLEEKSETGEVEDSRVIAIFKDPHPFLVENMSFIRMLRDACRDLRDNRALIVCLSPSDKIPIDLRTDMAVIRPGLPSRETIKTVMHGLLTEYGLPTDKLDGLADACVGLTLNQATDALAKSVTKKDRIDLTFISGIKTEAISSVPGLTYIGRSPSMDDVGGLDGLKIWLSERKRGFSDEARAENLPIPRGVLCTGVSGCGKSLIAKACASYYGMPLVRLNPPDLKGGIVGETEGNMRLVQESIESLGNCVVWETELELEDGRKTPIGEAYDHLEFPAMIKGFSTETGRETFVKMLDIIKRPEETREIVTIELESGKKIRVTKDHRILVRPPTGPLCWKEASTLNLEDDIIETT